jgi:hypothetical protein
MAIHKMRGTYEKASAVLVLDVSLMVQTANDINDVEIIFRILICKWTSRLWTFQEGALALRLFFQFADGLYDLRQGLDRLMDTPAPNIRLTVQRSIVQQVNELCRRIVKSGDHADMLITLCKALCHRTTNVLSDEPICLANLLGLDSLVISEIPASDEAGRTTAFWGLTSNVPFGMLFPRCERLCSSGFQWDKIHITLCLVRDYRLSASTVQAPTSLLRSQKQKSLMRTPSGTLNSSYPMVFGRSWAIVSVLNSKAVRNIAAPSLDQTITCTYLPDISNSGERESTGRQNCRDDDTAP